MPGTLFSVDPKKPDKAAEAILAWIKAHEHDEETAWDRYMRDLIEAREQPIKCLRPSQRKKR